ncbi:tRNA pseudouridine synthase D [Phycisphaerales bacterium]|nr:tRNA pseudouridine synthase D [Phycisphaerales bacterium]
MNPELDAGHGHARPGTHVSPRAYLTHDLPAIGGRIKERPEDFLVDEIPLYHPVGQGEHLYMLVQKRSLSTIDLLGILAQHFGVPKGAVGYAGLKDKHALTRQVVSVHIPGRTHADFPMLQHDNVQVLWAEMHTNKLRPGHLSGNRFSIRIRGVRPTDVLTAQRVLSRLRSAGVPNRVGEQRFGMLENNHLIGRALVLADFDMAARELLGPCAAYPELNQEARRLFEDRRFKDAITRYPPGARTEMSVLNSLSKGMTARAAFMRLDETVLRYYLSAFQSAVFNAVLDARIAEGALGTLRAGDVAVKHANGAAFLVDDPTAADPATPQRLADFEISPSGPLWGASMLRAAGPADELELRELAATGVSPDHLRQFDLQARGMLEGKRRPLRVPLIDPEVEGGVDEHGPYVRCAFELPRGSFATVVLREIMKPQAEKTIDAIE